MTASTTKTRTRRLAFAVAATLAATVWAAVQDGGAGAEPASASAPPTHRAPPATQAAVAPAAWPEPPSAEARPAWRDAQPQGLAGWGPPPPAAPPPAPSPAAPAPPQPPEFPYTLIGRLDDGQPQALLAGRTRSFGAKAGDVIDGDWRVETVDPDGVTLTWLPGAITRTLNFPSS